MADNIIGIKFGVAGGKGFQAGSSGALIKEQLEYIASRIKLKVNVNKTYFKNQLSSLKKELDKTLGSLNIKIRANVKPEVEGGGSSGGENDAKKQGVSYEQLTILKLEEQDGWGRFWNGVGNNNGWEALKRATGMYHSGGFVGDFTSLKSNEEFAKLLNGEFVSTPRQMDNFMKKTLPMMLSSRGSNGATINNNSPLIEIKCGDVNENTLPKLKSLVDQAVTKIEKNMESALTRTGYKKKF